MSQQPEWIITADELASVLNSVILVDVREPEENEESKIENSILIPLGELEDRASRELDANQPTVVYCAHGIRSLEAVLLLKQLGFKNVRTLQGGIESWFQLRSHT